MDLNVITCGYLHKKSPHGGGPGDLLLVVNVTGQREYSYKIPIFAQVVTVAGLGLIRGWEKEQECRRLLGQATPEKMN